MFDATTLSAVVAELYEKILHGHVQDIVQLDALTFGFEIYAHHERRYLYVTAHPDDARAHLVAQKLRRAGESPSPLLLALRKHAENALIAFIQHHVAHSVLREQRAQQIV